MYKSKQTSFNGIWQWVQSNRYDLIKDKPINKEQSNLRKLIRQFLIERDLPRVKQTSKKYNNIQVQNNFKTFKRWIHQQ